MRNTENEKTTITLENCYGEYSIKLNESDLDIHETMDRLIKPLLVAAGFSEQTVDEYFGME